MDKHIVVGVHVTDRLEHVPQVQGLLSEYGCYIKTRLGLHEVGGNGMCCSKNGLLLLEMTGIPGTLVSTVMLCAVAALLTLPAMSVILALRA